MARAASRAVFATGCITCPRQRGTPSTHPSGIGAVDQTDRVRCFRLDSHKVSPRPLQRVGRVTRVSLEV